MKRTFVFIITIFIVIFSTGLILQGTKKFPMYETKLEFPGFVQLSTGEIRKLSPCQVTIIYPTTLSQNRIVTLNLFIQSPNHSKEMKYSTTANDFSPQIKSRLDIVGAQVDPPGNVHSNLIDNQEIRLTWNIMAVESYPLSGALWLYLEIHSNSSYAVAEDIPVYAIPLYFKIHSVLGLSEHLATGIGIFGIITGTLFVFVGWNCFHRRK
jgi:hypothetical protein